MPAIDRDTGARLLVDFRSRLMPAIEDGRAVLAMERNGAEIVTTEMAVFEWLATAQDPRLREVLALVR